VSSGSHPGGDDASCIMIASTVASSASTSVVVGATAVVVGSTSASVGGGDAVAAVVSSGADGVADVDSVEDSVELHPATIPATSSVPISDRVRTGATVPEVCTRVAAELPARPPSDAAGPVRNPSVCHSQRATASNRTPTVAGS
jgi:hypothetical protein